MNYGKGEERSSSRSRSPSMARYAATSAILTAISSKSDRAPTSPTVSARPGWAIWDRRGPPTPSVPGLSSRNRQSAESFLLLAHLSGDVVAELLLDILLGLGIEVGHVKHPANFDHFVILSGDARGPFERLFARLHLDDPVAADHFLRFGKRTVSHFRFSAFEGDAHAHRRGRGQPVERQQHAGFP